MKQGSSRNAHHVKPKTFSSTLSMKKLKKNIKPQTSKYQNTKETFLYVSSESLHPNDIFLYRSKASPDLAKSQLYFLIKISTNPIKHLIYLKDLDLFGRHFRFIWFQEFPWLCYSRWKDGAYCFYCALFDHKSTSYSRMVNLYSQSFRKWSVTVKSFKEHTNTKSGMHLHCKNL